jgi:hypothetical protein
MSDEESIADNDLRVLSFDPAPINMAYCRVNAETSKIDKHWGLISIKDSTNEGSCQKLAKHLDKLKLTDDVETIIVHEQQPRCNIKTITICGQLHMYFVLERINEESTGNIRKIVGHHAKHKIKYYEEKPGDEPMPLERLDKLKKGHYKTKQILIEHCKRLLKQNGDLEWLKWFEKQKKKDDLADSYVQALSYIKMNKLGKFKDR